MTVCITNDEITIYPDGRLDTKNASRYTGLAEKTMAMMRCKGNGPKFIKRGRIFYFREDLDTWLNAAGRFTSTLQAQQAKGLQVGKEIWFKHACLGEKGGND